MALTSLPFLMFFVSLVFAVNISTNIHYRTSLAVFSNSFFIASYITAPVELVGLGALLTLGYVCVLVVRRWPNWRVATPGIVAIILLFIYLKRYSFVAGLPQLPFIYLSLGLSYILFRVVHLIVDIAEGDIMERVYLADYFNYTCNSLTFVTGPIQRFQDYLEDKHAARSVGDGEAYEGFRRVAVGYFKVLVISAFANAIFHKLSMDVLGRTDGPFLNDIVLYAVAAATYTIFLYYNFSGCIDVVIGFGILMGLRLPENFNRPFQAANFLEFWGRWHMTLSHWFRDYLFNPLLRALMGRFSAPGLAPALGVFSFFVTFLAMGVWHGATPVFIVYGLVMGAGASINKAYQLWITKRLGRKRYRDLAQSRCYGYTCRGVTFAYFTMAVTALWVNIGQLAQIGRSLGGSGVIAAFAVLTLLGALGLLASDILRAIVMRGLVPLKAISQNVMGRSAVLALVIIITLGVNSFFGAPPEFVYRAF